jgi:hypothetical protein
MAMDSERMSAGETLIPSDWQLVKRSLLPLASLAQTAQPPLLVKPLSQDTQDTHRIQHLELLSSITGKDLRGSQHEIRSWRAMDSCSREITTARLLLLQTAAHFMFAAHLASNGKADELSSTLPVTIALELAQQVSRSGLLPQLAEAGSSTAQQLACATLKLELHDLCRAAALLQLSLAVARMWPQGSLKSAAAGALAAPTARLAVALMQRTSHASNSCVRQQPIVAGSAVIALQMVQQLNRITPATSEASASPPAPHLQQLQASSAFLWLMLLVLSSQMQQHQGEQAQQQQAAAALLGSSAHQLWQQQHVWQQHSSADDLLRTLDVLEHLLDYWRQQQQRLEVLPELAGPGVQLLQLAGMNWMSSSDVGRLPGRAALDMLELALDITLPCHNQWEVYKAVLQQWTLLWKQLLSQVSASSSSSSQAGSGREAAGTSRPSVGVSATAGASELQTHRAQVVPAAASAASSSAAEIGAPAGCGAAAGSLGMLLPELPSKLSHILYYVAYESDDSDSSSTTTTMTTTTLPTDAATSGGSSRSSSATTSAPAATFSSSTSSSNQRVSFALQATAAAESCVRDLAVTGLAAGPVVGNLQELAGCVARIHEGAVSRVQAALLPSNSSETEHAQQQLREAQLPALCSSIKAMPMNRSADCALAEGAQQLLDSMLRVNREEGSVADACVERASRVNSHSSSSSYWLAGTMSVLMLLARWLRVRALQLRFACNMEPSGSHLQQEGSGMAGDSHARSVFGYIEDVSEAVLVAAQAAGYASEYLSAIIQSCSARGVPSASSNTGSSSSSSNMASSSSSSTAIMPLEALQHLQQRVQELRSCAETVFSGIDAADQAASVLAGRPYAPTTLEDNAAEYERRCAEFSAASSFAELRQMLGRYDALWQLPGSALLLSEQLLAGLPCNWCCNNPGCTNTAGPSERALVRGKSCAGCRTARWVLGKRQCLK